FFPSDDKKKIDKVLKSNVFQADQNELEVLRNAVDAKINLNTLFFQVSTESTTRIPKSRADFNTYFKDYSLAIDTVELINNSLTQWKVLLINLINNSPHAEKLIDSLTLLVFWLNQWLD